MAKDAYYFSHDANAQHDARISILRLEHGWFGYGLYWAVVEKLRDATEYRWPSDAKAGLIASLCDIKTTLEQVEAVFKTLEATGLIVDDGSHIFSQSLLNRMKQIDIRRQRLSDAGKRGVQARLKQPLSQAEASFKQEKKRKENKSKEDKKKYCDCVFLSDDEHKMLVEVFGSEGTQQRIQTLSDYVMSTGKKYRSHYHTLLSWERRRDEQYRTAIGKQPVTTGNVKSKYADVHCEIISN